jgi:transcriptional regulator with GAF, ATPase, and Fis domain
VVLAPGTILLNGKKVKEHILAAGDRIEAGKDLLLVDWDGSQAASRGLEPDKMYGHFARFAKTVGGERDVTRLLNGIISILFDTVGGTDAFIFKLDASGKPLVFVSSCESNQTERFSDTVVQEVLQRRATLHIPNALADPLFGKSNSITDLRLTSVVCCPIAVAGRLLGIIYLGSNKAGWSFTNEHISVVETYAIVAGMLIDHVDYIGQQRTLIQGLSSGAGQDGIVAQSKVMLDVLSQVTAIASSDITVLLHGQTGTGKDIIAQLIHRRGKRGARQCVVVNCSSLRKELIESELFGHKRGSFTGALTDHAGLFSAADGGTLFLDEVGELDLSVQARLLRAIETGYIRPVGASAEQKVDVRIICATNRDLGKMVTEGTLREDLYYRLNQFSIAIPPLRDRGEDILLLAYFFLEKFKAQYPEKELVDFHPDALRIISTYEWPGNVRELATVVHRAVLSSQGPLAHIEPSWTRDQVTNLEDATRVFQKKLVMRVLESTGGNKEHASKLLGVHRSTLFRFLSGQIEKGNAADGAAIESLHEEAL